MNDTFCILPWIQLIVRADGTVQVCNRMRGKLREGDEKVKIGNATIAEAWNCSDLREMRRKMVDGDRLSCCQECYDLEDVGARSLRQEILEKWRAGFLNDEGRDVDDIRSASRRDGFSIGDDPRWLQLDLGSLCNLACRMCNSGASDRIRLDPVHGRWSGPAKDTARDPEVWFRRPDVIADILRGSGGIRQLHVIGGEPMLIGELRPILQSLVDAGVAGDIELSLHTNATRSSAPWFGLLDEFRQVVMYLSVDGYGADYEYIRYPGKWSTFHANAAALQDLPNTEVRAHVVVQAYNVTRITELFDYLDAAGIPFEPHLLTSPVFLRASILPAPARSVASARLRRYADLAEPTPVTEKIRGMVSYLDEAADPESAEVREFMLFTNDLDMSRKQRLAGTNPELAELMRAGGWVWTDEIRYGAAIRRKAGGDGAGWTAPR